MNFFSPNDFIQENLTDWTFNVHERKLLANMANAKLQREGIVVYGADKRPLDGWNEKTYESTTHRALLIDIQPIEKAPCVHEPKFMASHKFNLKINECSKCGVKLKATWEQVDG